MSSANEPSPFLVKTVQFFLPAILWVVRTFFGWNRLEHVDLIELEAPIADVIDLYGEPEESKSDEDFDGVMVHTFSPSVFHDVTVREWRGKACLITYWSANADPIRDLKCMLKHYGKDVGWKDVETGYSYFRKDDKVRLWCSAAPAIGVATTEYLKAESVAKRQAPEGERV